MPRGYNARNKSNNMHEFNAILTRVSKPARYTGGEWNSIVKNWKTTPIKIALCYPEIYEIGMSNLAIAILYDILNEQPDVLAERVFAPWTDMEVVLREGHIPLFSLESKHRLSEFDVIGFSLGYELTYTNILNILDLAKIPLFNYHRDNSHPLIIAGGSCALNPEPMADFIDLFVIGEGEEIIVELLKVFRGCRENKEELLRQAAKLPGVYVPRFYQIHYNKDGIVSSIIPTLPEAKPKIERRLVAKLPPPVRKPVLPYIEVIHEHGIIEIQRGCTGGCRFCQAGMIYRPVRKRPQQQIEETVAELSKYCGYNEISLLSLDTGSYIDIEALVNKLANQYYAEHLSLSLPSLRLDSVTPQLTELLIKPQHKITLTFAPEAGSERLRRVINKNIPEQVTLETLAALNKDWINLKLYFMIGLPSETLDDVKSIIELIAKIGRLCRKSRLHISISILVPKPHTPCQWIGQETEEKLLPKYEILKRGLNQLGIRFPWLNLKASQIEAALSMGDRRLSKVIYRAWQLGCKFDAWSEYFNYQKWVSAFEEHGLDISFYANRRRTVDETLPWDHIDTGVTRKFLETEYHNLWQAKETPNCSHGKCNACGLQRWSIACREKYKTGITNPILLTD